MTPPRALPLRCWHSTRRSSGSPDAAGPSTIEAAFSRADLSLPAEWDWERFIEVRRIREANCGIVGGTNTSFLQHFARLALDLVLNPGHASAWAAIPDRDGLSTSPPQAA